MADVETDAAQIDAIQYYAQANDAAVTTPASGLVKGYFVGNEARTKNSAGAVITTGGAAASELTIASGAITRTQLYHRVDTEADASSDNLDTISGGVEGQHLYLRPENTARTVVLTQSGNIRFFEMFSPITDGTIPLFHINQLVHLIFDGTNWNVIGLSVSPNNMGDWGGTPDSDIYIAAQASDGTFYKVRGDEMQTWIDRPISSDIGVTLIAQTNFRFTDSTDRTVTISGGIYVGMALRAKALAVSGGTGHKILLPAGNYWNDTGTDRAALFDAVGDYIDAIPYSIGGGNFRFTVYASSGITFAAS